MVDTVTVIAEPGAAREVRRPALSPSRASDFKQCPLLYRFRAVDRIPEKATKAQVRGTVVHAALERLFALPAAQRDPQQARALIEPSWAAVLAERPELREQLFGAATETAATDEVSATSASGTGAVDEAEIAKWLDSARELLRGYFALEDPRRFEPEACELRVEAELASGLRLRGFIDRLDVAPTGEIRVVDYKTGAAPREIGEAKALFQMKFYALMLYRLRGVVPRQLRLMYLSDGQDLIYQPDAAELVRFERLLDAVWQAILRAGRTGDFPPNPSKLCDYCDHKSRCPAFGGTPPPYPGWPEPEALDQDSPLELED